MHKASFLVAGVCVLVATVISGCGIGNYFREFPLYSEGK